MRMKSLKWERIGTKNLFPHTSRSIPTQGAGFKHVEALGRIIIRGQSGRVLVWLSVWSKVQTTL